MKTKKCISCKKYKPINNFHKDKNSKDSLYCYCKTCVKKRTQAYYLKNKKKIIEKESKKYICNSLDKHKAQKYKRWVSMKYRYKITKEDYVELYNQQKGKCAICGCKTDKNLYIDHNHKSKKIRGLLCIKCNFGLGCFKDDIRVLERARKYLRRYR